ncbi:MAG TPA: sigma-E factor regulatory protein RseB domain-containing protein [Bryobacteraceae bacterium]|jgi:outer membrane lipoprotein-sorting protein|nr:sigma-E factor regulatory protein RseB domain-containing protein [Bryobacteraceae bacterium]
MIRFVLLAFLAVTAGTGVRAESLNDILARMDQSARNFRTFSAKMKRTEYTKILNDKEETDGLRRVRRTNGQTTDMVELLGKNPQTVRLSGKTVEVYYPDAKRVEVYDAGKFGKIGKQVMDQLLLLGIGVTSADLRRDFEIKAGAMETIGGMPTTRIDLFPKDGDLKKQFEKIEMWIPEKESVPLQIKVTRTSGDYNQAVYSDVQMNPALPDSAFELKLPPGVKRVPVK